MTKRELIEKLAPFDDDIKIVIRLVMLTHDEDLNIESTQYAMTLEHEGLFFINVREK